MNTEFLNSRRKRTLVMLTLCCVLSAGIGLGVAKFKSEKSDSTSPVPPGTETAPAGSAAPEPEVILAAQARVEGASETVEVGAGIDGLLSEVRVNEGQTVRAGELLAVLACDDLRAEMAAAKASIEVARQSRERLLRGSRDEERRVAQARLQSAKAEVKAAELHWQRMVRLESSGDVSRDQLEQATRNFEVATANLHARNGELAFVSAAPLPEETAKAEAEIHAAEERWRQNIARVDKCRIHAPISGTVLRVHKRSGETVSVLNPLPILELADTSKLRARVEVDERDLGKLHAGQKALLKIDAYPTQSFTAYVASFGQLMGRKSVKSGDPADKSDRDVLEVMLDLDKSHAQLAVGLRVTAQFLKE